ncbi:hypothetical protein DWZ61_08120 [Clostridium sp. AF34-10BH]|nr:hypothetical protein DWZ61_08120 [Clostridium sp. AF34-10BH]
MDDATGSYKKGQAFLIVASANRENGISTNVFYSKPFLYSEDPDIVAEMSNWKKNDLVSAKGVITTLNANKGTICAHCHEKSSRPGEVSLITPIYIETRYTGLEEKEATRILNEKREISNQVYLLGSLCDDVNGRKESTIYKDIISQSSYKGIAAYQIAVDRKYYLKQDVPTNRTDYPHIISVGAKAEQDLKCIHKGSMVLVDGMVVTREFRRTVTCPHCGKQFDWPEKVLEVLTFGTEYLADFMTPEEYDKLQAEKLQAIKNDIFTSSAE